MTLRYKILIAVLVLVIIAQGLYIMTHRPSVTAPAKPVKVTVVTKERKPPVPVAKGTIAIVIDDWGYTLSNLSVIEQIPYPMTLSVLPNLPYSLKVANALHERGFEIILHLPKEPLQKMSLEKNTILTTMDSQTIKAIIDHNLSTFPYMRGISNHMGSRVTEDNRTMQVIMSELRTKNLYFLDSITTSRSVASVWR